MGEHKSSLFNRFAKATSSITGKPITFIASVLIVVIWAVTGPLFKFSDTWQLVINTGTTIITFLMVFLIQNTQNRDSAAVQLKLDELICAIKEARNEFIDVEDLDDRELAEKRQEMLKQVEDVQEQIEQIDDAAEDKEKVSEK